MVISCASGCAIFSSNHATLTGEITPGDSRKAMKLNAKGVERVEASDLDSAAQLFQEAIAADPSFGPAHNNLGLVHFENRNLYAAATQFETASQIMPDKADPFGNLALALEAGGKVDEAIPMLETAHNIDPTNPVYLGNLIRARMRRGDADDTIRMQLNELLFIETRPEWIEWTQDQLAFFMNPRIQAQSVSPEFDPSLSSAPTAADMIPPPTPNTTPLDEGTSTPPYPTFNPPSGIQIYTPGTDQWAPAP